MTKSLLKKTDINFENKRLNSKIEARIPEIDKICNGLFQSSVDFDAKKTFEEIHSYIKNHERFLYSIISNYIFHNVQNDSQFEVFSNNIESIYEYMETLNKKEFGKKEYERMDKIILKLYDHVHLAFRQFVDLKETEAEFERKFNKNAAPFETKLTRDMSAQLLTMISIFTALAFLIFGGITSLENLFSYTGTPILKITIIGTVWGLCMLNLIFVFLICVSKMAKIPFESNPAPDADIFEKYPIIWWTDLIILFIFALSAWLYYITQNGSRIWFDVFCSSHPKIASIGGIIIIVIITGILAFKLHKATQKKKNST